MSLAPGKGAFLVANEAILSWLHDRITEVVEVYSDELHDQDPKKVQEYLLATDEGPNGTWEAEKDNFGTKVYAEMPYKKGSLRVTLVLTKQNELKLDIREWFNPEG